MLKTKQCKDKSLTTKSTKNTPQSTSPKEFIEEMPCKISTIATVHPNVSNNHLSVQAAQTRAGGKEPGSVSNSPKCTYIHICMGLCTQELNKLFFQGTKNKPQTKFSIYSSPYYHSPLCDISYFKKTPGNSSSERVSS